MIRTGEEYRDSIRDGRRVWINGERVTDVTRHPMFKPIVDIRARIYDMQHEPDFAPIMAYRDEAGVPFAVRHEAALYAGGLARQTPRYRCGAG